MIDPHVLDAIRAVARAENTPDVLVEAVVRRLLPSIRLVPQFPKPGEPERVGRRPLQNPQYGIGCCHPITHCGHATISSARRT